MRRRDVVFWYGALNPYMAERFSALSRLGSVDFECWTVRDTNPDRSWIVRDRQRQFPHRIVNGIGLGSHRIGLPIRELVSIHPRVIVTFHADPAVVVSLVQRLHPRCDLIYYVEKTFDTWTPRHPVKEVLKRLLFSGKVQFFSPGTDADAYLAKYGVNTDRVWRLEHAIDYQRLATAQRIRKDSVGREARARMGLRGFVYLYLGRVWWQKGLWTLLAAHERLMSEGRDATLLVVGDGTDRTRFREEVEARQVRGVVMRDFVQQDELPEVMGAADALVFPTRGDPYGLVVDEAMAAGLPVIASTSAGEIRSRVAHGATGLLVAPDDQHGLWAAMDSLLNDTHRAQEMGEAGAKWIEHRTPDRWAHQVSDALRGVIR